MIQYLKFENADFKINSMKITHRIIFLGNSLAIAYAERKNGAFILFDRDFNETRLIANSMRDAKILISNNREIFKI